jgi:hypothetical protein
MICEVGKTAATGVRRVTACRGIPRLPTKQPLNLSTVIIRLTPTRRGKMQEAFVRLPCAQRMQYQCKNPHLQQTKAKSDASAVMRRPFVSRAGCEGEQMRQGAERGRLGSARPRRGAAVGARRVRRRPPSSAAGGPGATAPAWIEHPAIPNLQVGRGASPSRWSGRGERPPPSPSPAGPFLCAGGRARRS